MARQYFTTAQVAEMFAVPEHTVRRWIRRGDLAAVDIGREYRISEAAVIKFDEQRSTKVSA